MREIFACLTVAVVLSPAAAFAQNGLGDVLLGFWERAAQDAQNPRLQIVNGQLYGTTIDSRVANNDGNVENLGDADRVLSFLIQRGNRQLAFTPRGGATPDQFADWADANASALVGLLFPTSISQSVSGRDAAKITRSSSY